jgi:PhoPQ-activated pathogenicity-related protein
MAGRTSALLLISLGIVSASVPALTAAVDPLTTALDDYMAKPEAVFNWSDTGARITTLTGGTGHVLNVTSLTWLDVTRAYTDLPSGPTSVWTHQVIVVVPKKLTYRNISLAYLTGGCNENPRVPSNKDEDLIVADTVAKMTEAVAIVVYQIPNCKVVFPSGACGVGARGGCWGSSARCVFMCVCVKGS